METVKKRQISLETNAYRLAALLKLLGNMDIATIGEDQVTMVQRERLKDRKAPATINSETRLLKQIVRWALDKGLVGRELNVEKIPEPRRRIALPTQKEVEAILAHLPESTALLVHLLGETGFPSGEAFHLQWNDLDFQQNTISVQPKGPWTPKTQHSHRTVALTPTLMLALGAARSAYLATLDPGEEPSPLVFRGRGGGRVWDFRKALATAVAAAGVTRAGQPLHITPHMFRKAHATWLAERGVNEALLQPRLGHAPGSRVTQESYVHVQSPEALKATVIFLDNHRRTA
ncbi:MAG: tyrosine-type recombinase/integrase [Alphaproteobacteria bacterium]|nr:tyrosine-type recombinase/integrase [Alphaproteobacteria bacterium]MBU1561117.1 tyrosine-type recombinase/integrase [Alphaproteobacteria bacterium]MBU2301867.1 tyrosine-type recombinase/integrase [Alphaproteobacteria bacterium]MBU2368727.1 tyrosine-type recombinase/integrase [Alphaproteobacteria bacterium]